jgi:hypothetical protein
MSRDTILEFARQRGEGFILSAASLKDLGSPFVIMRTLIRLEKTEEIAEICRGRYVVLIQGSYGPYPPEVHTVLPFIEHETGHPILVPGICAANLLDLTTQIPMRQCYITAGPSMELHFGKHVVEIRHVDEWLVQMPNTAAGNAIRAVDFLGEHFAEDGLRKLRGKMSDADWSTMAMAPGLPEWFHAALEASGRSPDIEETPDECE